MKIIVDTREQNQLQFTHPLVEHIEHRALSVGDYACEYNDGYIPPVRFERKSIPDLFGTLGKGYPRFKREIIRAQQLDLKLIIVVEGTLLKILKGHKYSSIDGISILKKLFTLMFRYGISFHPCYNREEMAQYITWYFIQYGYEYIRRKKEGLLTPRGGEANLIGRGSSRRHLAGVYLGEVENEPDTRTRVSIGLHGSSKEKVLPANGAKKTDEGA